MTELTLTNMKVTRVLSCMHTFKQQSLADITQSYNQHYPPGIFGKLIGRHATVYDIKPIIAFLMEAGLVHAEFLSYTDHALKVPEWFYRLSQEGIRYLSSKDKKIGRKKR